MQKNIKDINLAVELRKENKSIKEIAEKINKSTSTVKRWLAPYNISICSEMKKSNALKGSLKLKEIYALKRKEAYDSV